MDAKFPDYSPSSYVVNSAEQPFRMLLTSWPPLGETQRPCPMVLLRRLTSIQSKVS